nr:unnamed protein product [Digitaria exilis]
MRTDNARTRRLISARNVAAAAAAAAAEVVAGVGCEGRREGPGILVACGVLQAFSSSAKARDDHEENINKREKHPHVPTPPSSAPLPRTRLDTSPSPAPPPPCSRRPFPPAPEIPAPTLPARPRHRRHGPRGALAESGARLDRAERDSLRARGAVTRQAGLDPRDPAPAFPHLPYWQGLLRDHSCRVVLLILGGLEEMQRNGVLECSVCCSKVAVPSPRSVSRAYDKHRSKISSKYRALNVLLVSGDCILVGLQPILVFMSKVDGKFQFSPISVNFLTEVAKVIFAIIMLIIQSRKQKVGEKPLLSLSTFVQAARSNVLLAVPALLYAINNYLKFIMQLYFNPATVKMLSNLKVLVIAVLLKIIMRRKFSIIQWEALALLLIGISVNQLRSIPAGTNAFGLPVTAIAYAYTLIFVTVPSFASVYNEYALKSQFDTSIYLQNLFLYGYGAIFNFLGILGTVIFHGPESFDILRGHSRATLFLICNNAAQGILSSFFFKYAGKPS